MPNFDYKCEKCGHIWEQLLLNGEDDPTHCNKCKSINIRRLIGSPIPIFKASGFPGHEMKAGRDCKTMMKGKKI